MADIKKELNDIKNAVYGREVRSSIHDGIKKINEESEESKQKADDAYEITQDLLDETFDSAALEANFEQRLDNEIANLQPEWTGFKNDVTSQLAHIEENTLNLPITKNGKIVIPNDFPEIPFGIYKKGDGTYYYDATPYNQYDWSNATEIFVTSRATSGSYDGTDPTKPIYLANFISNLSDGVYGGQKDFIISFLDNVLASGNIFELVDQNINLLIRSKSINGFTWWSRFKRPNAQSEITAWTTEGGIYKTTQATNHVVVDVVNLVNLDEFGNMPTPYKKASSLAVCQSTKGTFYQNGLDVYCNPYDGHDINKNVVLVGSKVCQIKLTTPNVVMFENIGFGAGSTEFSPDNLDAKLYFFGCKFFRNFNDAFVINGQYKVFVLDCVASYASKDCFNYHSTSKDSLAVEVNSFGYGAGMFKLEGGNTTTHSNNGSTAHDGMNMLRVGGKYWDCEGPVVADVNNCNSISIGCDVGGLLDSTTGVRAGFYFNNDANTNRPTPARKLVIDSTVSGKYFEHAIVGTELTYEVGTRGLREFDNVQSVELEDVVNE